MNTVSDTPTACPACRKYLKNVGYEIIVLSGTCCVCGKQYSTVDEIKDGWEAVSFTKHSVGESRVLTLYFCPEHNNVSTINKYVLSHKIVIEANK